MSSLTEEGGKIAAPPTSMLMTLENTESTIRPGKGRIGVGGNSSDDGGHVDDGGGGKLVETSSKVEESSSDAPKSMCPLVPHTSMLKTSSSTDLSTSAIQSAVKYDEVDGGGKSVKKSSKSQRIVIESKNFKGLKNL